MSSLIRLHPNALKERRKTKAAPPPFPFPSRGPRRAKLALEVREGVHAAPPASTNPISTECTARNPCPIAGRATPRHHSPDVSDAQSQSRIFQPTSSREAALGRSTGGKPGHRGGWKKQ